MLKELMDHPEKVVYRLVRLGLSNWMSDERYLKTVYRIIFKRRLDLEHPSALTEKINWMKLHWRSPLAKRCADKWLVRDYIREKVGDAYLIEAYGCWDSVEEIDFSRLPDQFVLKPTNGSGDVFLCEDKRRLPERRDELLKAFRLYGKVHFSAWTKEWACAGGARRIMAERYLPSEKGITDYKFFCFYGEPQFLFVATERKTGAKFDFFDMDWNWFDVRNHYPNNPSVRKPERFEEMKRVARTLSKDFPHVRVDLYEEEAGSTWEN